MPTEPTADLADVIAAGTQILAEGRRISAGSLRRQIGTGTGSRLLALWTEHQAAGAPAQDVPAAGPVVPLPPALLELETSLRDRAAAELSRALASAWSTAERLATDRLSGEIAAAREEAQAARDEAAEYEAALRDAEDIAAGHGKTLQAAQDETQAAVRRAIAAETLAEERERQLRDKEGQLARDWDSGMDKHRETLRHLEAQLLIVRDARLAAETLAEERGRMLDLLAPVHTASPDQAVTPRRGKRQEEVGVQ